jgi:anoctamin-10
MADKVDRVDKVDSEHSIGTLRQISIMTDTVTSTKDPPNITWDYCMVFKGAHSFQMAQPDAIDDEETAEFIRLHAGSQLARQETIVKKLKGVGLRVSKPIVSHDKKFTYILISASEESLEIEAERMKLGIRLEDNKIEKRTFYRQDVEEYKKRGWLHFSPSERLQILYNKITDKPYTNLKGDLDLTRASEGGANIDINRELGDKIIADFFPLHNTTYLRDLYEVWVKKFWKKQPRELIRAYFGEKIAFYFTYLGFYTIWLWLPSIVGLALYIYASLQDYDVFNPIFALLMAFWSTVYLEFWKRKQAALAYVWDVEDYESAEERYRPEFLRKMHQAFGKITKSSAKIKEIIPGVTAIDMEKHNKYYYPAWRRRIKLAVSIPFLFTVIAAAFAVLVAILTYRQILLIIYPNGLQGPIFGSVANALFIAIMNPIYVKIATALNNWELYPSESTYENNLILKVFGIQFVNSFTALGYIAFYEQDISRTGEQLAGLLVTSQIINNLSEVITPYILRKYNAYNANAVKSQFVTYVPKAKKLDTKKFSTVIEQEASATVFMGTFNQYAAMMIQFGYVTMFVSAFSLAPALAFVNNILQIRTDALKLCKYYRRPLAVSSSNIGSWLYVLEALSIFSVITNCFLIFVSLLNDQTAGRISFFPPSWGIFEFFVMMVLVEHAMIVLKLIIAVLIPDHPDWITEDKFRQEIYDNQGKDKLDQVTLKSFISTLLC